MNLIASNQNKCDQCSIDSSRNSTFSEDYNPTSNAHIADDEADACIRRPQVEVQTVYCTYIEESDDDWPNAEVSGRRGYPQAVLVRYLLGIFAMHGECYEGEDDT